MIDVGRTVSNTSRKYYSWIYGQYWLARTETAILLTFVFKKKLKRRMEKQRKKSDLNQVEEK